MATNAQSHDDTDDAPLSQPMIDPVTGTAGVGPITPGSARGRGWDFAARWFIFALLLIAFCLCLYWFFGNG